MQGVYGEPRRGTPGPIPRWRVGTGREERQGGIKEGFLEEGAAWLDGRLFTEWTEPSRGSFNEGTAQTKAGHEGAMCC